MTWTPPWRSEVVRCRECENEVAKTTLDREGRCVTCVARPPEPEPSPDEQPPALFDD